MNKIILITFLVLNFIGYSQSTISINIGADYPLYKMTSEFETLNNIDLPFDIGYYGGLGIEIDPFVSTNNWFIKVSALYNLELQNSGELDNSIFIRELGGAKGELAEFKSILIPFGIKYWKPSKNSKTGFFFEVGGFAKYNLTNIKNGLIIDAIDNNGQPMQIVFVEEDYKALSFGGNIAIGLSFGKIELAANAFKSFSVIDQDRASIDINKLTLGISLRYVIPL